MTYSIKKKNNLITPERAATYLPVFISSGIAILLVIFLKLKSRQEPAKYLYIFISKKFNIDKLGNG